MTIEEQIKQKIAENFNPVHMELVNESGLHKGHAGDDGSGQTHFKLMVVSSAFEKYNRIQRHKLIYDSLGKLFSIGLHALSIKAITPTEYRNK